MKPPVMQQPVQGTQLEAARIAVERHYDLVVAAGGDGTINEVVNGMAEKEYRA